MKSKKYLILFISVVIALVIIFTSVIVFSNTGDDKTREKVKEEISYIEIKLLGMINSLNNIPFSSDVLLQQNSIKGQSSQNNEQSDNSQSGGSNSSTSSNEVGENKKSEDFTKYSIQNQNILINDDKKIDWDYIKNSVEELHTTWTTIMIDLHSLNVKNDDILNFSNNLDALVLNIEKEDKRTTLNSLASLYSIIPIYASQFLDNSDEINIDYTKSYIINSYVLLEDDKWDDMQKEIEKAQEYFGLIINSMNENRTQSFVNKTYILLNEITNAIKLKDKKLYYLKYKNLMENALSI